MKLSIVTTLYKSGAYVEEFHRRASEAAQHTTDDYEIVMVDDGSPDNSLDIACAIARTDSRVRVVELSRNFGHHKAMMAGLDHSHGELCFLIDSDHCTVRLMRREYVDALLLHRESNTVIGGLWVITGFRQVGSSIAKGHRKESSYSVLLRLATLFNAITSFSTVPLNLMVMFGMVVSLVSFAVGFFVVLEKLLYNVAAGWASLIVSIWFMGGIIIFCLGVIGIYISRVFVETKNRPYVIVRRIHQRAAP